jgi:hypothetical protein
MLALPLGDGINIVISNPFVAGPSIVVSDL